MDDREIVGLFFARNENALREASKKYGLYCTSIARNILNNHEDAEECVNETYMRAWESIPPNDPPLLGAYLGRIAKNLALNKVRSLKRQKRGGGEDVLSFDELDDFVSGQSSIETEQEQKEIIAAINAFLKTLPAKKRQLFVGRYWNYCRLSELGERFGMSESSVAVNLGRIRERLKKYLKKRGYDV